MKRPEVLWIVGVVAALVAFNWIQGVRVEREDLRERFAALSSDYEDGADLISKLEKKLAAAKAALPRREDKAYKRGRADGIAYACNGIFGNGFALDAWTHSTYDDFGERGPDIRAVIILTYEDGSTGRTTRADCRRFA